MEAIYITVRAARQEFAKRIGQGFQNIAQAKAAVSAHDHLEKVLALIEGPLSQVTLFKGPTCLNGHPVIPHGDNAFYCATCDEVYPITDEEAPDGND